MGTPKALVSDESGSWLLRGLTNLAGGGCDRVTLVLGAETVQSRALLDSAPESARIVVAEDWDEGMGASLRAGLRSLADSPDDGVVVSLVDLPDLVPAVVARVVAAADGPAALARASYDQKPGHPVLLGRQHWAGVVRTARGDRGARDYLATHEVALVECGDLATGRDVDSR